MNPEPGPLGELKKRCGAICGEDRSRCFVTNASHLECISDIVINKVWAARAVIEMGARENRCEHMAGILSTATGEMDALLAWMKNIQVVQARQEHDGAKEALCRR
jgi:hypothetical protein